MQYAISMSDGSVRIMTVLPARLLDLDGHFLATILGHDTHEVQWLWIETRRGRERLMLAGRIENLDIGSIDGCLIEFYDVERDCLDKWPAERRARVASWRKLQPGEIPADRTFRDAWTDQGERIERREAAVDAATTIDELKAVEG